MQIYFLVSHDLFLCFLKMYTSNSYKIYDMSQFVECVREAHKKNVLVSYFPHFNGRYFYVFHSVS